MQTHHVALGLLLAGLPAALNAQQLVLPDNTNLIAGTSLSQAWRSTAGRFQVCYDTTHFTNAGVTGPVTITRLRFRGVDGEPNPGGQVYTGVTVEVGDCVNNFNALSSTFAANRGTMGPLGTTNVTVQPSLGTLPNNNIIDIDLVALGATFVYDPTLGLDLLIDISCPTAPSPSAGLMLFSGGSSTLTTARARMIHTGIVGSPTGSSIAAPICTVDFTGGGGYAAPVPARLERFGHGGAYGVFRSFYQDWRQGETFDLANTSITLTPDNVLLPSGYTVTAGTTPVDFTKLDVVPDSTAGSAVVTHALGFTFNYVSGSTSTLKPSTKGYVWMDPAMTAADFSPTVNELLSRAGANLTARLAPLWSNWDASRNASSHPNAGLHVITDTTAGPGNAVCYATWYKIGRGDVSGAGFSVSDFQAVFHEATGVMEMRFGNMDVHPVGLAITGWSPGKVASVESNHPGPFDLSHELALLPLQLGTEVPAVNAVTHDTLGQARPILGTTITPQAFNMPAGMLMNLMIVDVAPLQPGVPLPGILAPGCVLSLPPSFWVYDSLVLPPAGAWNALPLLIDPVWATMGLQFYSQVASLDGAINNVLMTNALRYTVGLN